MTTSAPESRHEGTDETLTLPGVVHALWAHREDGEVRLEAWSPGVLDGQAANICLTESDRVELAEFLLKGIE